MATAKPPKYFVNQHDSVTIQCRKCGKISTFPVNELKHDDNWAEVTCICSESFKIVLEFRKDFRRKTNINGFFRALSTPRERARRCVIADLSDGGLLLHFTEKIPIKTDDQVIVSYRPDNTFADEVEKVLCVRHYTPGYRLGGAFIDTVSKQNVRSRSLELH